MISIFSRVSVFVALFAFLPLLSSWRVAEAGEDSPVFLQADEILLDSDTSEIVAKGHVRVELREKLLEADEILYRQESRNLRALGNVRYREGDRQVTAERLETVLRSAAFSLFGAKIVIFATDPDDPEGKSFKALEVTGVRIECLENGKWRISEGTVTPCDCGEGHRPSWSLSCKEARVREKDSVHLTHPVFRIKDVPVFWLPSASVPLSKRKSGFLAPRLSFSERLGARWEQEYFWAFDRSYDLTFGLDGMMEKGVRPSAEFRYHRGNVKGRLGGFYLYDLQGDQPDTPSHRFALKTGQEWRVNRYLREKAALNLLSDTAIPADFGRFWRERSPDYSESRVMFHSTLREIYMGIGVSRAQRLFSPLRQDGWLWSRKNISELEAVGSLFLSLPNYSLLDGILLFSTDGRLDVFVHGKSLPAFPPAGTTQAENIGQADAYLNDGSVLPSTPSEQLDPLFGRLTLRPRLSFRHEFGKVLRANLGAGMTHYGLLGGKEDSAPKMEGYFDLSTALSSQIHRVFEFKDKSALKHEISPRIQWDFVPHDYEKGVSTGFRSRLTPVDQRTMPHTLSFGLDQRLAMRRGAYGRIHRFLKLELEQRIFLDRETRRRFQSRLDDALARLSFRYRDAEWINELGMRWRTEKPGSAESRLRFGPFADGRLSAGYLYLAPGLPRGEWSGQRRSRPFEAVHQVGVNPSWTFRKALTLFYGLDLSLDPVRLIEQNWGLSYRSPCRCWKGSLLFVHRPGLSFPDVFLTVDLTAFFAGKK